jgi:hypothetical protein
MFFVPVLSGGGGKQKKSDYFEALGNNSSLSLVPLVTFAIVFISSNVCFGVVVIEFF